MITATIIADSVSAPTGQRITTFELEYPRFIHAELMTHRQFSRNSASSRAIPIDKMIELVQTNTAEPIHWGRNQSGMQAGGEIVNVPSAIQVWTDARNDAIKHAKNLQELGLHKQIVNRVLEPFQIMKVIVTATSFDNFFNLRCHPDAQPEIRHLAELMLKAMQESTPETLSAGEWHTPYVHHERDDDDTLVYFVYETDTTGTESDNYQYKHYLTLEDALKVSCSCAAQVSYRKNDTSIAKAISIYDKLVNSNPVHASAFEHCATPIDGSIDEELDTDVGITHFSALDGVFTAYSGNFANWVQYRQLIPNHDCKKFKGVEK